MTINEARKLKVGDTVINKYTNRKIVISDIEEKSDCTGNHKYIEITSPDGGVWTHKELIYLGKR